MKESVLIIDTGSSSMRGVLFGVDGEVLFIAQKKYTMTVSDDGAAVMPPVVFSDCLHTVCAEAASWAAANGCAVAALSLDAQRSSVLPVSETGEPLGPIIMWYDKRCSEICADLNRQSGERIYTLSGMKLTPVSSAPKMGWLKLHQRDIYDAAHKLIGIHDYLLFLATGALVTDATCACRTALMDIRTLDWSDELCAIFGIARDKLCPIVPPGSVVGSLTPAFSAATGLPPALPVVTAGGDQQCCVLGQALGNDGTLSLNSGSASYLALPVRTPLTDPNMEVNLSAYTAQVPWLLEASNMGSGTVYQWFNSAFYNDGQPSKDSGRMDAEVMAEPVGSRGLICLPDFAGRGCPATDPDARGLFIGAGMQHTRGSFARALLEGICLDISESIDYMKSLGAPVLRIQSTGGLTKFTAFNQILADCAGLPVIVKNETEATARGAFFAAASALGLPVEAGNADDTHQTTYLPDPDAQRIYDKIKPVRQTLRASVPPSLYSSDSRLY